MTTITAETILRSRHAQRPDKVLSTLLLRYPRWIHAELMTHRVLSRNAASSRAIKAQKLILDVINNPAEPIHWGRDQSGMQAHTELTGREREIAQSIWHQSRAHAIHHAQELTAIGAHKQVINRILEPYAHITVLVSSTEWSNFLALRDHPDAEPHIAILAREIRRELDRTDNIQTLEPGEWHMPFANDDAAFEMVSQHITEGQRNGSVPRPAEYGDFRELQRKLSVACCASTSYKTVDGFDMSMERAIKLHDRLVGSIPIHASPAEHVAQADELHIETWDSVEWAYPEQHANFVGFRQYRKMLPGESQ